MSNLVAAEVRYHVPFRTNFENLAPKFKKKGRPTSTDQVIVFEKTCESLEDKIEPHQLIVFEKTCESLEDEIELHQLIVFEKTCESLEDEIEL